MKTTESEALSRVAFYCSSAEHCRYEVEEKLRNGRSTNKPSGGYCKTRVRKIRG